MVLVQPAELAGKIMTLFDTSMKKMVIISPYCQVQYWEKLKQRIAKSQSRGVRYEWYYRAGQNYDDEFNQLKIKGVPVDKLHAKIYFNEKQALVTSMNLYQYSDTHSIEIGYMTETEEEYNEIILFFNQHVLTSVVDSDSPQRDNRLGGVQATRVRKTVPNSVDQFSKSKRQLSLEELNTQIVDTAKKYIKEELRSVNSTDGQIDQVRSRLKVFNFSEGFDFLFEARGDYDRVIIQPRGRSNEKRQKYDLLKLIKPKIDSVVSSDTEMGGQMKRLKWTLSNENRSVLDGKLNPQYSALVRSCIKAAFGPLRLLLQDAVKDYG